ncbi:NAD(P)H-hydrate epimerase [Hydrobacter penzbergensis]|uniref:Bifunctional NAD(P)H-hydrate repair enzyme n=1 Tax=Hydrobacter penzbergensis TaxID=1235997 RepID=A0A8X8II89_9BACT|nr:NAD(P)H-hydrate dehydratase [Hydrobacter penzbergensis]SDX45400.1 NAD(P)H-hydrate epimerase [Hydrobacter penzbergensis]
MKLLSAQQCQQWDAYTMQHEPIASIDLMERAGLKCTEWLIEHKYNEMPLLIFCGKGNNGGDGLVIARQMIAAGAAVTVYILEYGSKGTDDFQRNLEKLHRLSKDIHFIQSPAVFPVIEQDHLVIDALFGTGLNRPLHDLAAALAEHINQSNAKVIAIDVPSGMPVDNFFVDAPVLRAHRTLTFQSLKYAFLLPEYGKYTGDITVLDIGLMHSYLSTIDAVAELVEQQDAACLLKGRDRFSHKGNYGHALLLAGNKGKMGAAILAAKACLRSGVGLLTTCVPDDGLPIIQTAVSEAMTIVREAGLPDIHAYSAIAAGPGLGLSTKEKDLLFNLLQQNNKPMVLDADALTILSQHTEKLTSIPPGSLFTPHPKEFDRLFGTSEDTLERYRKAIQLSAQYHFIIILKGHRTLVAAHGRAWFNTTGNVGMAKGGSGDVLTGILTALLAQGYDPLHAAILGVYLHGLAGDIALKQQSVESLLPSDLIESLGNAFNRLKINTTSSLGCSG